MRDYTYDPHAQHVFQAFKERIDPLLAEVAPDWLLRDMRLERRYNHMHYEEEVVIQLVIRPLGYARELHQHKAIK